MVRKSIEILCWNLCFVSLLFSNDIVFLDDCWQGQFKEQVVEEGTFVRSGILGGAGSNVYTFTVRKGLPTEGLSAFLEEKEAKFLDNYYSNFAEEIAKGKLRLIGRMNLLECSGVPIHKIKMACLNMDAPHAEPIQHRHYVWLSNGRTFQLQVTVLTLGDEESCSKDPKLDALVIDLCRQTLASSQ